jgi:2'-5' RNA ligase
MRCFVAIELSDAVRRPLERLLAARATRHRDVRWCTGSQLHITLEFLGDVDEDRLAALHGALATAAARVAPFDIRLAGWGAFPAARRPRVLWCGVDDPAGGAARWMTTAEPLLTELGFPAEERPFTPHVTLARSRGQAGAALLEQVLRALPPLAAPAQRVSDVVLFESVLRPAGAEYRVVERVALGGAP